MLTGNLARGALLLGAAISPSVLVILPLAFAAGLADSMVLVTYIAVRAAAAPDELIGRIGSTMRTISVGLQPIGMVVGGAVLDVVHGSATLAGMGALLIGISLAFAPARALRDVRLRRIH